MEYFKISIVTPNFNGSQYLEKTILSVIEQNYPNLEYIIIDGESTDGSVEIIKKYEKYLSYWISEPDTGMYSAIQKGFDKCSGDIMGWINSDDMLHAKSLITLNHIFQIPEVKWVQGQPVSYGEEGFVMSISSYKRWSKYDFWRGNFQWIQQESTFWQRDLWNISGARLQTDLKLAGDMELWNRFFIYERLYTVSSLIGGFRQRSSKQLSLDFLDKYIDEAQNILNLNTHTNETLSIISRISKLEKAISFLRKSRIFNQCGIIARLQYKITNLMNFPPEIRYDRKLQQFYVHK